MGCRGWIYISSWLMLRDFVVNWWPLLGLTFYCVLLYIFWRTLQLMPRVKPATVIVDPRDGDRLGRRRRRRRGEGRAGGDRRVPPRPEALRAARCGRAEGRAPLRAARHRQDAARQARPPTSPARSSTRRAPPRSSRCSPASARRGFASSSTRRARTRPRSSSSTSSTPSAPRAPAAASTASRIRRSTSCSSSSTASPRATRSSSWAPRTVSRISIRRCCGPGRFDRQMLVAPPDRDGREAILARAHAQQAARPRTSQLDLIARQTSGLTGADLANIANEAAILAGRRECQVRRRSRLRQRARACRRRPAAEEGR